MIKKILGKLLCRLGWHKWGEWREAPTLYYRECKRCGETQIADKYPDFDYLTFQRLEDITEED